MKLVFTNGAEQGREVELKPPFISIGRETDNDIVLSNEAISRYHAKIEKDGNIWVIRDLESSNGVRVNGQKIEESSPVTHKDEIRISDYSFVIRDETLADGEEHKSAFNIDPGLGSKKDTDGEKAPAKDTPAQKMIRLGVTALCTMLFLLALIAFLVPQEPSGGTKLDRQEVINRLVDRADLKIHFREEKFGKDPRTGEHNVFVYRANLDDRNLRVSVRNVIDSIDKPQEQIELNKREVDELKELLKDDHFVNVESPAPREQAGGRYERTQLMMMAGNRGNCVEYVNTLDEVPSSVNQAIDRLKTIIEERLQIPKLTYEDAVKEADRLFRLADKKYRDRRVDPLNLFQSVNYAEDGVSILSGYSKAPPFLMKLKELHDTAQAEFKETISMLMRDASIAERSKKYEKAMQYYKEVMARIGDSSHPDYVRAVEGVSDMQQHLTRGSRKK